jgi:hypothetical protein
MPVRTDPTEDLRALEGDFDRAAASVATAIADAFAVSGFYAFTAWDSVVLDDEDGIPDRAPHQLVIEQFGEPMATRVFDILRTRRILKSPERRNAQLIPISRGGRHLSVVADGPQAA